MKPIKELDYSKIKPAGIVSRERAAARDLETINIYDAPRKAQIKKINPRLKDCIYGLAVGDALGVPFEFLTRGTFRCAEMVGYGTHSQAAGTWSDDTSLTLATCESIKRLGHIDTRDIMNNFRRWLSKGEFSIDGVFDVGGTCAKAIGLGHGLSGERDNGNGALMRIAPIAFTDADDELIDQVSSLTHAHEISVGICRSFVKDLRSLINGDELRFQEENHPNVYMRGRNVDQLKSGGFVRDTYEAAWYCISTTNSYADAVIRAVNLGSDTDTTAAVTGALAGVIYGYKAIPNEWINTLRGKDLIDNCLF